MTAKAAKTAKTAPPAGAAAATKASPSPLTLGNYQIFLVFVLVNIVTRLPIVSVFNMVTFDGTYYVNQAKALLQGAARGGSFPVGYPAFIALLIPVVRDGVIAAQVVSFLAGIVTTMAVYVLAKRFLPPRKAFFCALVVAVHPLFMRLSLLTYSESLAVACVFIALVGYAANRSLFFGIAMGLATITRPEALAIFGLLMLLKVRRPKWLFGAGLAFVILYSLNAAYLSKATGRVVLLPNSEFFGASAQVWQLREQYAEFEGKEAAQQELVERSDRETRLSSYVKRLPGELRDLHQLVLPVLIVLAAFGMYRKPTFVLAALVPFLSIPAFTVRAEPRYLLPYIPILILYAFIGAEAIGRKKIRAVAYMLIAVSTLANLVINKAQVLATPNPEYRGSKLAGLQFKKTISRTDKIADRKPFFAFYAEGEYVQIPLAPYEEVMQSLASENVRLLSLHQLTTPNYRPILAPLLYDHATIMGELRYKQIYVAPTGELIYEKVRDEDPLEWRALADVDSTMHDPCWSPDGTHIAFRAARTDGRHALYIAAVDGTPPRFVVEVGEKQDPLAWSPDSGRIAFAQAHNENADIYTVDVGTGRLRRITSDPADDFSPSWAKNGKEIAFCSERSGTFEIWITNLDTGRTTQISKGGENRFPMFSNDGNHIAWLQQTNLVILDRTSSEETGLRGTLLYRPTWSPDDRFIATESYAHGVVNICLITADLNDALLLTKGARSTGMPCWSPRRDEMAVVSKNGERFSVGILTGLEEYLERLENPPKITTFTPPVKPSGGG